MARARYQIRIGDNTFPLETEGGHVFADGTELPLSMEPLGGGRYSVLLEGRSINLVLEMLGDDALTVRDGVASREIRWADRRALLMASVGLTDGTDESQLDVRAPMPGLVRRVLVSPGEDVGSGDSLLILEAMKMENELRAGASGTVTRVHAEAGDSVVKNQLLIEIEF